MREITDIESKIHADFDIEMLGDECAMVSWGGVAATVGAGLVVGILICTS